VFNNNYGQDHFEASGTVTLDFSSVTTALNVSIREPVISVVSGSNVLYSLYSVKVTQLKLGSGTNSQVLIHNMITQTTSHQLSITSTGSYRVIYHQVTEGLAVSIANSGAGYRLSSGTETVVLDQRVTNISLASASSVITKEENTSLGILNVFDGVINIEAESDSQSVFIVNSSNVDLGSRRLTLVGAALTVNGTITADDIIVRSAHDITLNNNVTTTGFLDIQASEGTSILHINGDITVADTIYLLAGQVEVKDNQRITVQGDVIITSFVGAVNFGSGTYLISESGKIIVIAETELYISYIIARESSVGLRSNKGSILSTDANDTDIETRYLRLEAYIGIGRLGRNIDDINTSVDYLAAVSGVGGINIRETNTNMDSQATSITEQGDIRYVAGGQLLLSYLSAVNGTVSVSSGGSTTAYDDGQTDILANNLIIVSAYGISPKVGSSVSYLDVSTNKFSAVSGQGGIFVRSTDGMIIDSIAGQYNQVNLSGVAVESAIANSGITTFNGGSAILIAQDGDITVSSDAQINIINNGNVLLDSSAGKVIVNGNIKLKNGTLGISAADDITFGSDVQVVNFSGDISINSNNSISMSDTASMVSVSGNLHLSGGKNVQITGLEATGHTVVINAGSLISSSRSNEQVDIRAENIVLNAAQGAGISTGQNLNIYTSVMSGFVGGGGMYVNSLRNIVIGDVTTQKTNLGQDNTTISFAVNSEGLSSFNGADLVVSSENGSITNDSKITAFNGGNILIKTNTTNDNIIINNDILAKGGNITIDSVGDIYQNNRLDVIGWGDLTLKSLYGDVVMGDNAESTNTQGDVIYYSGNDIYLNKILSDSGTIKLVSGKSIERLLGSSENIRSEKLILQASESIGSVENIEIRTGTLSAVTLGEGGMGLYSLGSLTTGLVEINESWVNIDGSIKDREFKSFDVVSFNGDIVILVDGSLIVTDSDPDNKGIYTIVSGDISVKASGIVGHNYIVSDNGLVDKQLH